MSHGTEKLATETTSSFTLIPAGLSVGATFMFTLRNSTYLIASDMILAHRDVNATCGVLLGEGGRMASLGDDDDVMTLYTELRAQHGSAKLTTRAQRGDSGFWVDVSAHVLHKSFLKDRLNELPLTGTNQPFLCDNNLDLEVQQVGIDSSGFESTLPRSQFHSYAVSRSIMDTVPVPGVHQNHRNSGRDRIHFSHTIRLHYGEFSPV